MPETTQPSPQEPANNSSLPRLRHELRSWTRDLAVALGLALVIIIFLYQPVKVEGTSMAPSTFTGWYRKIMMTSASPKATAKSRVQLRNSCRKRGKLELFAGSCGLG